MPHLPTDESRAHWESLHARWKPIPTRPGYALALSVCSLLALLLPLIYFAIIGAIAYVTYLHIRYNAPDGSSGGAGGALMGLGLYVALALAGLAVVVGLIKPLIAFAFTRDDVRLQQFEEIKLHSFVENVCTLIGAPVPKEIRINCDVNAGAGFRRGVLSYFLPGDLVLIIGLPIVAGLTKRQFAGVLAHEFGHFSQGLGMRATGLIDATNAWFSRLAYSPDIWTIYLHVAAHMTASPWLHLGAWLASLLGWLARLPLMALAVVARLLSTIVGRQMEYDADRYEIRLAGSKAFSDTMQRMGRLAWAHPIAVEESRRMFLRSSELPDNLPAMIAANAEALSPEDRAKLDKMMNEERTGWLDTHPSFRDRAAHAQSINEPGLLDDDSPATELFVDFDAAAKRASGAFFRGILGPYFIEARPVGARVAVRTGASAKARATALGAYLGFEPLSWRPIFPPIRAIAHVTDAKPIIAQLKLAMSESKRLAAQAAAGAAKFREASEEAARWERVRHLMDAGFAINFKTIKLASTTRNGVSFKLDELKARTVEGADAMDEAADHAMSRLAASLSLLGWPGLQRLLPDADAKRARASVLLAAGLALQDSLRSAREARHLSGVANDLEHVAGKPNEDKVKAFVRLTSDRLRDVLDDARRAAGGAPDPFAPADAPTNLGETLVGASPAWRDFAEIFVAGNMLAQRQPEIYQAVIGELVDIALSVEKALAQAVAERKRESATAS